MRVFLQDLSYSFRVLRHDLAFSLVAVLTLALGIGANSAIYSVVQAVVLKPLPHPDSQRLVQVWSQFPTMDFLEFPASPPEYMQLRERADFLEDLGGYVLGGANLTGQGEPVRMTVCYSSASFFSTFGAEVQRGRLFDPSEDLPGGDAVIVISHGFWQSKFGAAPDAVGRSVSVDGTSTRVIGVLPADFDFPDPEVQAWLPLGLDPANPGRWPNHYLRMVGKLKAGTSLEQARVAMGLVLERWDQDMPGTHHPRPERHPLILNDLHEQTVGQVRPTLIILLGAVAAVLLIACANVANLLLARGDRRAREVALRRVLGAARWRMIRQLLTESLALSWIGGAIGIGLGYLGLKLLLGVHPDSLPRLAEIRLDGTVLLVTVALATLTGILFGLAPALQLVRSDLHSPLKEGTRSASIGGTRQSFRRFLVVLEMALAVVLVVCAALMIRSFTSLRATDPGFDPTNRLTLRIQLPQDAYPEEQQALQFYESLLERLKSLPGVEGAAAISSLPMRSRLDANDFDIEGWIRHEDSPPVNVDYEQAVSPGYFRLMKIPLRLGRVFTEADRRERPSVAVVSQSFVDRFWPRQSPLGKRVRLARREGSPWVEIVGVVGDVKQESLRTADKPHLYVTMAQNIDARGFAFRGMDLVIQVAQNPLSLSQSIRELIWRDHPDLPIADIDTLESVLGTSLAEQRLTVFLSTLFAGGALGLAALGIYGVLNYMVTLRIREIGVRMALGAQRAEIVTLVVRQGMVLALAGLSAGVLASLAVNTALAERLQDLLFQVSRYDLSTYAVVSTVLILAAFLACYIPARRATRVDPLEALRYE